MLTPLRFQTFHAKYQQFSIKQWQLYPNLSEVLCSYTVSLFLVPEKGKATVALLHLCNATA